MLQRDGGPWDYRMTPNKMLELVKNMGNMELKGTGFFVDNETEMMTILAYLNYGETTNITESMAAQIDNAVKEFEEMGLGEKEYSEEDTLGALRDLR